MKTTVLSIPLLLVVTLAVPWIEAAPLEAALEDKDLDSLQEFLKLNPSIAEKLFPKLVNSADYVSLTIDPAVVSDLVAEYAEENAAHEIAELLEGEEGVETEEEKEHARQKRQTSVSGGINSSRTPFGRSIGGSATVNRAWDNGRHSLSGTVGTQRDTIRGLGSFNSHNAGVGYNFSPNKATSFGVNAHKSWTPAGNSHGFGVNFSHKFGR